MPLKLEPHPSGVTVLRTDGAGGVMGHFTLSAEEMEHLIDMLRHAQWLRAQRHGEGGE